MRSSTPDRGYPARCPRLQHRHPSDISSLQSDRSGRTVGLVVQAFDSPLDEPVVNAVQRVAEAQGASMAQVALAWVLKSPVVTAPIVGATKPHHLPEAIAALDYALPRRRFRHSKAVHATWALLVLTNCPPRDRGRPVGPDLRIMWPTPLPFCAQVHGQVDESEGRGRDDGRPPVPAAFRHGGHHQSGG